MKKQLIIKFAFSLFVVISLSIILQKSLEIDLKDIEKGINSFGIFAPIVYFILLFLGLSVPFNPISDYLLVNLAAFVFPPVIAIIATFVAHTLAISCNYILAKNFGWRIIGKFTTAQEADYLTRISQKINPKSIFYLRWLLPLTAVGIDLVSYAGGLARLPFGKYYLASILPWTILSIIFFVSTKFLINERVFLFFIPGLVLAAIPIAIYYFAKRLKKK